MDNTELSRMDKVSGGLGKWGSRKSDVATTIYANEVQESLKTCLYLLGKAFDDVTINPNPRAMEQPPNLELQDSAV